MGNDEKIIQIIPADNWFATFKDKDGPLFHLRLMAIGLSDEGRLYGIDESGKIVDDADNFYGYTHADDIKTV